MRLTHKGRMELSSPQLSPLMVLLGLLSTCECTLFMRGVLLLVRLFSSYAASLTFSRMGVRTHTHFFLFLFLFLFFSFFLLFCSSPLRVHHLPFFESRGCCRSSFQSVSHRLYNPLLFPFSFPFLFLFVPPPRQRAPQTPLQQTVFIERKKEKKERKKGPMGPARGLLLLSARFDLAVRSRFPLAHSPIPPSVHPPPLPPSLSLLSLLSLSIRSHTQTHTLTLTHTHTLSLHSHCTHKQRQTHAKDLYTPKESMTDKVEYAEVESILTGSAITGLIVAFTFASLLIFLVALEGLPMIVEWFRRRAEGTSAPQSPDEGVKAATREASTH